MTASKLSASALALTAALVSPPQPAFALTSVEGTTLGDQGYYWHFPQEAWIFYHRIRNIDNRAMLQLGAGDRPTTVTADEILDGDLLQDTDVYNVSEAQLPDAGGAILEVIPNLHLGLWLSEYSRILNDRAGLANTGFIERAESAIDFTGALDDLNDPRIDTIEPNRKVDFFVAYAFPDLNLETGLKLHWGSTKSAFKEDNSSGPVNLDPTGTNQAVAVDETVFAINDLGVGLSAGWLGLDNRLRIDFGFGLDLLGITYEPRGVNDYIDAGGTAIDLNLRGHFNLFEKLALGAFVKFRQQSLGFEPKKLRNGGDLQPIDTTPNNTLPDPEFGSFPGLFAGTEYNETFGEFQIAALAKYTPTSRATLYAALGLGQVSASREVKVGDTFSVEESNSLFAFPFINVGVSGQVLSWLEVFIGATKRWQAGSEETDALDERIPNDGETQNGGAPPAGNEDNTNANRREQTTTASVDASTTSLSVGARVIIGDFQIVTSIDTDVLLNGPYFIFGADAGTNVPAVFMSLIYDWDSSEDKDGGNGTVRYIPDDNNSSQRQQPRQGNQQQLFDS